MEDTEGDVSGEGRLRGETVGDQVGVDEVMYRFSVARREASVGEMDV